jgi:hypothetical protein
MHPPEGRVFCLTLSPAYGNRGKTYGHAKNRPHDSKGAQHAGTLKIWPCAPTLGIRDKCRLSSRTQVPRGGGRA